MRKNETPRGREETTAQALLREVRALRADLDALTDRTPEGVQPGSPEHQRRQRAEREALEALAAENQRRHKEWLVEEAERWRREWEAM